MSQITNARPDSQASSRINQRTNPRTMVPYHSAIPRYHQIAKTLRLQVAAGGLGGQRGLATEAALCAEFGVSRTTIRHALGLLKQEGVLQSRRGVGTRMLEHAPRRTLSRSAGDPLHGGLGSEPRIVSIERALPPAMVAAFLGLDSTKRATKLVRVHDLDGEPVSVVITWLPARFAHGVTRAALTHHTLHDVLLKQSGVKLERSVHTIRVARADATIASWLGVALADPMLHIQASAFLKDGTPVRWTDNYFNEERYQYTAEMQWNDARRFR